MELAHTYLVGKNLLIAHILEMKVGYLHLDTFVAQGVGHACVLLAACIGIFPSADIFAEIAYELVARHGDGHRYGFWKRMNLEHGIDSGIVAHAVCHAHFKCIEVGKNVIGSILFKIFVELRIEPAGLGKLTLVYIDFKNVDTADIPFPCHVGVASQHFVERREMGQCVNITVLEKIVVSAIVHISETPLDICAVPQFEGLVPPIAALVETAHLGIYASQTLIEDCHLMLRHGYGIAYMDSMTKAIDGLDKVAAHDIGIAEIVEKNDLMVGIGNFIGYADSLSVEDYYGIYVKCKLGIIYGTDLQAHHLQTTTL